MILRHFLASSAATIFLCASLATSSAVHAQYNSSFAATLKQIEQSRKELANIPSADYGRIKLNLPNQPAGQQQQQAAEPPPKTWTERYLEEQASRAQWKAFLQEKAQEMALWQAWADKQFNAYSLPQLKRYPVGQRGTGANLAYAISALQPLPEHMKAMADSIEEKDWAEYGIMKLAAYEAYQLKMLDHEYAAKPMYIPLMALDIARHTNYMPYRTLACMWGSLTSDDPWKAMGLLPKVKPIDKAQFALLQEITQQCRALLDEPARTLMPQLRQTLSQTREPLPSNGLIWGCQERPELMMATREFWNGTNDGKDHAAVLNKVRNIPTQLRKYAAGCAPNYQYVRFTN
jgi:hypothetical protein